MVRGWLEFSPLLAVYPANGGLNQLRGGSQIKLLFDVKPVDFNRLDAQMKFVGNLTRAVPLTDQLEDLKLTVGK